jgi:hypothetical protein
MAFRANQTFHLALERGRATYEKNQVVPAKVAKAHPGLVYDDTTVRDEDTSAPYVHAAS